VARGQPDYFAGLPANSRGQSLAEALGLQTPHVELAFTVPTAKLWRVQALRFEFSTDSTVVNRTVLYTVALAVGGALYVPSAVVQTATQDRFYSCYPGAVPVTIATGFPVIPIPSDLLLAAGSVIGTLTLNFQLTDRYLNASLLVEEWPAT
jgi:hypothetical protein